MSKKIVFVAGGWIPHPGLVSDDIEIVHVKDLPFDQQPEQVQDYFKKIAAAAGLEVSASKLFNDAMQLREAERRKFEITDFPIAPTLHYQDDVKVTQQDRIPVPKKFKRNRFHR